MSDQRMSQRVFDLECVQDIEELFGNPVLFKTLAKTYLKLPDPLVARYEETPESAPRDLLLQSYISKYSTSFLYTETLDGTSYSNVHPFYGRHPMTCVEWSKFLTENMDILCREFMEVEDGEYVSTSIDGNQVITKQYLCRKHPEIGLVFRHSNCDISTTVKLYLEKDGVVYYLPSKVFSRSSGRFNRFTDRYYPESIKMMLTSVGSVDIEELNTTAYILYNEIQKDKPLSVEELQSLLLSCSMYAPEKLKTLYEESVDPTDDHVSDLLWRCTNLKKTLGDALEAFKSGTPKIPEVREFLGFLLYHPLVADRLYKSVG